MLAMGVTRGYSTWGESDGISILFLWVPGAQILLVGFPVAVVLVEHVGCASPNALLQPMTDHIHHRWRWWSFKLKNLETLVRLLWDKPGQKFSMDLTSKSRSTWTSGPAHSSEGIWLVWKQIPKSRESLESSSPPHQSMAINWGRSPILGPIRRKSHVICPCWSCSQVESSWIIPIFPWEKVTHQFPGPRSTIFHRCLSPSEPLRCGTKGAGPWWFCDPCHQPPTFRRAWNHSNRVYRSTPKGPKKCWGPRPQGPLSRKKPAGSCW